MHQVIVEESATQRDPRKGEGYDAAHSHLPADMANNKVLQFCLTAGLVMAIIVAKRVRERHPNIQEQDIRHAWLHVIRSGRREGTEPTQYISVGTDTQGRLLEMCAVRTLAGDTMIYHCNTAQRPMLRELRLI